jgi:predicted PurR-regulated permease PerM
MIIAAWFIYQIRGIIVSIFISYIIMAALLPAVKFLRRYKLPNILAVLIPYVGVFLLIFLLVIPLIPFVLTQISSLLNGLPHYLDNSTTVFGFRVNQSQIHDYLSTEVGSLGKNAVDVTSRVFGGLLTTLTVLVVSFYLLNYNESFKRKFARLFDSEDREHIHDTLELIDDKLGAWLRGQVTLCFAIGLATFVVLTILRMPYALPLALIAGILEVLPTLGPILSAVPAVIVALTISPAMALVVVIAYLLIQMLENNLLVPQIMRHAVGLNPVIVILSIMIGAKLMGIAGALLAIPFLSFAIVVAKAFRQTD